MISLNNFSRQWEEVRSEAIAAFSATGESGWYILGHEVEQFEKELAEYWGVGFAVGVASGLDAIEISLNALGCRAGDKVLTTPISAFATTLAILKLGAVPVFVDVDEYGLLDLDLARDALGRDSAIRFLAPVHLYGHALDAEKLAAVENDFGVEIVEDCAQSIGARWNRIATGTTGRLAATSFYPTKNLGAMGDGGAILTSDGDLARLARTLRDYGQSAKYRHDVVGYNSRLDELQAALLRRVSLPRLSNWIQRRREIALAYRTGIHNPAVCAAGAPRGCDSGWHLFPVLIEPDHKPSFMAYLSSHNVGTGEHYPIAIPDQRAIVHARAEIAGCGIERARRFCRSEVSLPIHPYLTCDEVQSVIAAINNWRP